MGLSARRSCRSLSNGSLPLVAFLLVLKPDLVTSGTRSGGVCTLDSWVVRQQAKPSPRSASTSRQREAAEPGQDIRDAGTLSQGQRVNTQAPGACPPPEPPADPEMVRELLEAARRGDRKCVQRLVQKFGVPVDAEIEGIRALDLARKGEHYDTAAALLHMGAHDAELQDDDELEGSEARRALRTERQRQELQEAVNANQAEREEHGKQTPLREWPGA